MLYDGILVSSAFPSRGRCPEGADRALAGGKRVGEKRLKCAVYESTRAPLRVNLYKGRSPIKNHSRPFHWKGRIGHRRDEREWERASQVRCLREHPIHRSASIYIKSEARLRIILAPSSGRGRRAKRGGVGIPACENAASRANLRPFGAPPSKGRREKRGVC